MFLPIALGIGAIAAIAVAVSRRRETAAAAPAPSLDILPPVSAPTPSTAPAPRRKKRRQRPIPISTKSPERLEVPPSIAAPTTSPAAAEPLVEVSPGRFLKKSDYEAMKEKRARAKAALAQVLDTGGPLSLRNRARRGKARKSEILQAAKLARVANDIETATWLQTMADRATLAGEMREIIEGKI